MADPLHSMHGILYALANKTVVLASHEALSGVFGSISLAAWIFLLIPQLIENYRQGSADGISLQFLIIWFIGDITNFIGRGPLSTKFIPCNPNDDSDIGAIWAGLVPTVIALAVYFCFADLVLLLQCLYYNTTNAHNASPNPRGGASHQNPCPSDDPEQPLLARRNSDNLGLPGSHRRRSSARSSSSRHLRRGSHTSNRRRDSLSAIFEEKETSAKVWVRNIFSVVLVCAAGAGGWFVAWRTGVWSPTPDEGKVGPIVDVALGPQVLGYFSALCYLGYVWETLPWWGPG
ncbi:MAG: hypothetical protein M1840_002275 [Geoglossum simile]|nr:MAG: hypothetical protein M1840_002275 [Geoglossum simile]